MNSRTPSTNLAYLLPVCLVATLGGLLFGYDTGVISGAIEPLTERFGLGDFMKGWASGCVLLGCAAGVLLVGPISDRFGRRVALALAALMFLASAIGTAVPDDIATFIAFRVIGGLGIGIASVATPMYIAEIAPAHLRGRMVAVNQIAIVGGIAGTAFVNYYIAHAHGDPALPENQAWIIASGWRWMFATGIAPALLFGVLLPMVPESPRWLVERKREDEARRILDRVGGPEFAASELRDIRSGFAEQQGSWGDLFSKRLALPLVIGVSLAILQQVTGINVFLYFGATIFKTLSAKTGVDAGLLTQIVINGACMIFTVIAIATVDKWGRRPLMLIGAAGMGLSLIAMGFMAQTMGEPSANWMLAFIILYIACFGLSVGPVTWVILSEIYPTAVRGRALGLATFFLWTADYVVTQTFPMMDARGSWFVRHFNHAFPFYTYAVFCGILLVVVWKLVPETKGRSLEDIERSWNNRG
ncbi:MAG: sugar porter family MFS transporter [Verrucomicrobia bacterium]|nr:sugar porter family MFS transporter [Verrucomicrobiota bacterium]